jgi:uncharacterized membrane protein
MSLHEHSKLVENLVWLFAGVAAVSLAQAAIVMSIMAAAVSVILGGIRIHDRIKYGPARGRE